jgi:N-acetylornithine carbamoyltransferase
VASNLKGKHLIATQDWSVEQLEAVMDLAADLKIKKSLGVPHKYLDGKTLFMLFFEESTRTRNSFEAGITQLGGHAHWLTPSATQIDHGESAKDTVKVLERYGHGLAVRDCYLGRGNRYMRELGKWASIPVFNMQCDILHPCQALADLFTIKEKFHNELRGRKFVISWTYAPKYVRPLSMPQSLVLLMSRFGMDVTLAHPPEFKLMPDIIEQAEANAKAAGTKFEIVHDMEEACEGAHVIYAKSWGALAHTQDDDEILALIEKYDKGWVTDQRKFDVASPDSIYMHCMPIDRGIEVTDEVVDGPHSVIYDEAENRLHVQKALMALTM